MLRIPSIEIHLSRFQQLLLVTLGAGMFVSIKTGLVALLYWLTSMPPWLNYLIVTISISILGWLYHSKISFRVPLSVKTLKRYIHQAIGLKLLDYALYNSLVYLLHVDPRWAVLFNGGCIFVLRVAIYMKYVFIDHIASDKAAESVDPE